MRLTFQEIAGMAGGSLVSGGDIEVGRVVIDSRAVDEDSVFVAIIGERLDGHQFLGSALETAKGAIVDRVPEDLPAGKGIVLVDDTTDALQRLARSVRRRLDPIVIGITGSAGKTTTKEMVSALTESELVTFRSWGNFNNHIGLPLCLTNTPDNARVVVSEMGMSGPGEIARLAEIAEPDIAIYTNVKPVHIEFFESIEGIAKAKKELVDGLRDEGTVVINAGDHRVVDLAADFEGTKLSYGIDIEGADFNVVSMDSQGLLGTKFELDAQGERRSFELSLPGRFNLENLLAAIAGARAAGVSWDGIEKGIRTLKPASHRGEISEWKGVRLYDDTYNSNPYALSSALELLSAADVDGRRIAVIGDMLELGQGEKKYHFDAGSGAPSNLDTIVGVGPLSRSVLEGAASVGFASENLFHFADAPAAAEFLRDYLETGDLVLLKGSRGIGLDRIATLLEGGD